MNIRKLEDLTKEELIELVKHEREHIADTRKMVPGEWKLVPVEPTDEMKKAGCQVPLNKAARHNACYKAMLAAAPQPDHIPGATKMVEPTLTPKQIAYWLAEHAAQLRKPDFGE